MLSDLHRMHTPKSLHVSELPPTYSGHYDPMARVLEAYDGLEELDIAVDSDFANTRISKAIGGLDRGSRPLSNLKRLNIGPVEDFNGEGTFANWQRVMNCPWDWSKVGFMKRVHRRAGIAEGVRQLLIRACPALSLVRIDDGLPFLTASQISYFTPAGRRLG